MNRSRMNTSVSLAATCGMMFVFCLTTANAQTADRAKTGDAAFADQKLKGVMERIEAHSDEFEDSFEAALDKSSDLNGTDVEDRLNRWADLLEDQLDDMAENYKERDADKSIEHLDNSLIVATGINRAMLRSDLAPMAEEQWKVLRDDLNTIAMAFRRPVLANVTVVTMVPATDDLLNTSDVQQVMERLEAATDRFQEKFDKAMNAQVVSQTNREELFTRWAENLEDVSDDLLDEYKEKDAKEVSEELQNTLIVAAAMNRMVLRSDLTSALHAEWETVRKDLNTLAKAFGHPVLGDVIVTAGGSN